MDKFKYWCHKILPIVYDDSLSYYEVLCKLTAKVNELISKVNSIDVDLIRAEIASAVNSASNSIKAEVKTLRDMVEDISEQVNTFIKTLNIKSVVEKALDDMYTDGKFNDIVTRCYVETVGRWRVQLHPNGIDFTGAKRTINTINQTGNIGEMNYSEYIYAPAPFPVNYDNIAITGSCNRKLSYLTNFLLYSHVGISYQLASPNQIDDSSYGRSLLIQGRRALVPSAPVHPYNATQAAQAVAVAQSYVDAQLGGRSFIYGKNFFYADSDRINDANGSGWIECDTYMGLVLRGINYQQSPYANTTPNYTFSYDNLPVNPNAYYWVSELANVIKNNIFYGRDLKFMAEYAFAFWQISPDNQVCNVFSDFNNAKPGDLVFHRNVNTGDWFDNVVHVGMLDFVEDENGVLEAYEFEVSGPVDTGGKILWKKKLSGPPANAYYGRIAYT